MLTHLSINSDPYVARDEVIDAVLDAQADLQSALGMLRLHMDPRFSTPDLGVVERRLNKSLARSHKLLDELGSPMYDPATDPDVN